MANTNFLIGKGELLTQHVTTRGRPIKETIIYPFDYAVSRLMPEILELNNFIENSPSESSPDGLNVARVVMHPSFISRSAFPIHFLKKNGFQAIGSKGVTLKPERWAKKKPVDVTDTTELFILGTKDCFLNLPDWLKNVDPESKEAKDFSHIEILKSFDSSQKIQASVSTYDGTFFEVGLHAPKKISDQIIQAFKEYAANLNCKVYEQYSISTGGLWFVPIEIEKENLDILARFTMVRLVRPISHLRSLQPLHRSSSMGIKCNLPHLPPLSIEPRVAILDGGLPQNHSATPWIGRHILGDQNAEDCPDSNSHGLAVTSAFLFGSIDPHSQASQPYSYVDHIRVLDKESSEDDPFELYRTLSLIEDILVSKNYQFLNLSLGPALCISDDEVHPWTSLIDDKLQDGNTFLTIAAGNNGHLDAEVGNNRIQVPSDCVNAVVVGAVDCDHQDWSRAYYSAVGPGRSSGRIKPDLMAFGGDPSNKYFHVLASDVLSEIAPICGTSFAAPMLLRQAVGIRAIMGDEITLLGIKALLVHMGDSKGFERKDVGWGKIPENLDSIITCKEGQARIIYQGKLQPGKYLQAEIPLPTGEDKGTIKIKATLCFTCPIDPEHSATYTQAGLTVTFRPHSEKLSSTKKSVKSDSFFSNTEYSTEEERRANEHKWDTVLSGEKNKRATSLHKPVFDIHYIAREEGHNPTSPLEIPYAMVITVESSVNPSLYADILNKYLNVLSPIQPKVALPIRV